MTSKTPLERFHEKYSVNQETGCWEWTAAIGHNGYARFKVGGKTRRAHRWIWEQMWETPSALVLHRCDNRRCVNPEHLFAGTQRDNIHDMVRKDRHWFPTPDTAPSRKLTRVQVSMIRDLYRSIPTTCGILARNYGVSRQELQRIIRNERWTAVA